MNVIIIIKNAPVTYIGHDLDSARVCLSFHQRWIASTASDGKLLLRLTGNPVSGVKTQETGNII